MIISDPNAKSWLPPFCPNPECHFHRHPGGPWPFKRAGYFTRQTAPRRIRRFTCKTCKRSFSTQTFSTAYWQKRPDLDAKILMKTVGGMANRQIARDLEVSPETINRHIARLGRHCMLFHWSLMQGVAPPCELVVDGFESFELSQYFPMHHNLAVEKGTDFFFYFNDSELRRKGRMKEVQKARRKQLEKELGRPDPKAVEKDMRELFEVVLGPEGRATLFSDDHPAYKRSLKTYKGMIDHRITPGSNHRDKNNSLWEVNLLDLLIRHSNANHKRETIAWSKRRQASAERLAILLVWRNYMKGRREKNRGSPTPAMVKGVMRARLKIMELLRGRIFRSHVDLPERWSKYYSRTVWTRGLRMQRVHALKLAA